MIKYFIVVNESDEITSKASVEKHTTQEINPIFIEISESLYDLVEEGGTYIDGVYTPVDPGPQKTIYQVADFMTMIPKNKYRDIRTAADANDGDDSDNINFWVYNVPNMAQINLNTVAAEYPWFIEGLESMVVKSIFTQGQIDSFLEI